jgi:membrane dipeptidase
MTSAYRLHRRSLVIDSLAGGPGVYTSSMLAELDALTEHGVSTPDLFREIERLHTAAFRAGNFDEYWTAIDRSGVDVLSVTVGAWGDQPFSFQGAVNDLAEWHRRCEYEPQFRLIRGPEDLSACKTTGKTGILLGFQNCTQLNRDLRNLETFHALGIRMIQLTYNGPGEAGDGCTTPVDHGLTRYGRDLVDAMNELNIIVDVSHCGTRTTLDAIEHSARPVAVSHAAASGVYPHARNKSDQVLQAVADTDGFFGVCLVPAFLGSRNPSLDDFVRHVLHAVDICGSGRVGIGTDWGVAVSPDAVRDRLQAEARRRGFRDGDGFDFADRTRGFEQWADGYPRLTESLMNAGLDEGTVEDILGRNFERFHHRVRQHAP